MLLAAAKRRALKAGVPFRITEGDITIPTLCPILGIPLAHNWHARYPSDNSPTLDRIDPVMGYVLGNIQVISARANRIKSDASPEELARIAEYVCRRQRSNQCTS